MCSIDRVVMNRYPASASSVGENLIEIKLNYCELKNETAGNTGLPQLGSVK